MLGTLGTSGYLFLPLSHVLSLLTFDMARLREYICYTDQFVWIKCNGPKLNHVYLFLHLYQYVMRQSVPSWLELELARAKKLELGWLGLARRQSQNSSLARLGLKRIFSK